MHVVEATQHSKVNNDLCLQHVVAQPVLASLNGAMNSLSNGQSGTVLPSCQVYNYASDICNGQQGTVLPVWQVPVCTLQVSAASDVKNMSKTCKRFRKIAATEGNVTSKKRIVSQPPTALYVNAKAVKATASVLSFIQAYNMQSEIDLAQKMPSINAKVSVSRPVVLHIQPKVAAYSEEVLQGLETLTRPFTYKGSDWFKEKHEPGSHLFIPCLQNHVSMLRIYKRMSRRVKDITAVVAVPYNKSNMELFSAWQLLKTVQTDNFLPNVKRTSLVAFFTDADTQVVKFTTEPRHTAVIHASIAGTATPVLLDTGATGSAFISKKYCDDHGYKLKSTHAQVTLGDKTQVNCSFKAQVPMKIGPIKFHLECLVLPDIPNCPIILGTPWLDMFAVDLSFPNKTAKIVRRHKTITVPMWQCSTAEQEAEPTVASISASDDTVKNNSMEIISAKKVCKLIQTNQVARATLLMVNVEEDIPAPSTDFETVIPGTSMPKLRLRIILEDFKHLFKSELPGISDLPNMRSVVPLVPNAVPPRQAMFRYSPAEIEEMRRQVTELMKAGLLEKSTSPFGAPVLFVKKKDNTLRMCIDYRGLNKITVQNRYPLPRIDDLLDRLEGSTTFSSLDLLSAYHQIRLPEEDVPKTAFRTPFGHFQYKVMPFGLTNAPSVFMAAMNDVLGDLPFVAVYLDDILIFSKNPEEHVGHVKQVLEILEKNGYILKLKKSEFFKKEIKFRGHVVTPEGVKPDPDKIKKVLELEKPKSVYEVRAFLGLMNYFRRYIHHYAKLARPLIDLTKGHISRRQAPKTMVHLNQKQIDAFNALKEALAQAPVLRLPDFKKPFQLITDASDYALGAILLQDGHPIAFESRQMSSAEMGYNTTDKELLAIVHALQIRRCYLEGVTFEVLTDHNPLTYLRTQPMLSRRQTRWAEKLNMFDFNIKYIPGMENPADILSWQSANPQVCVLAAITTRQHYKMPSQDFVRRDPTDIEPITPDMIKNGYKTSPLEETKDYSFHNDVWYHKNKIVLPRSLRGQVLQLAHDAKAAGHMGVSKTFDLITRTYWWPGIRRDVKAYVQSCDSCQRIKADNQKAKGLLKPLPIPLRQWEEVTMDLITDLPETNGTDSIVVFTDKLSKMVHFIPTVKACTASDLANIFIGKVWCIHGMPKRMIHDRDPRFTSNFWDAFFKACDVKQANSTAFHPQTDGQTERVNRVLEDYLRHYVDMHQSNWASLLPFAEFAYNNAKHDSSGYSPFYLNYGFNPNLPGVFSGDSSSDTNVPSAHTSLQNIQDALRNARVKLEQAQQRQKKYADKSRRHVTFNVGDEVLLSTKNLSLQSGYSRKLLPRFVGPFVIKEARSDVTYQLDLPAKLRIHNVFHISLLRRYSPSANCKAAPLPVILDGEMEY